MALPPRLSAVFRLLTSGGREDGELPGEGRVPWRPVPVFLLVAAAVASRRGEMVDLAAPNPSISLASVLGARGLVTTPGDIAWVALPGGVTHSQSFAGRALVRAQAHGDPSELYLVETRHSPEGILLEVGSAYNLTKSISADESKPLIQGHLAATVASVDGVATGVHIYDLGGRSPETYTEFSRVQRVQAGLTNLQTTGQMGGIVHDGFSLDPNANSVELQWLEGGKLAVKADERTILLDAVARAPLEGAGWVRPALDQRARPGNVVTWAVDRARGMEWVGEEALQYIKAVAFTALDYVSRFRSSVARDTSEEDVKEALGGLNSGTTPVVTFTDPEIGWPPAGLKPALSPPLPGEGAWVVLDNDPFITPAPGSPPAFLTTFVRADPKRPQSRVYVTLWDPRQIALHMEAGTVEPISATGEAGPGVIPRTPEVLRKVVAGFNGGFQALHGEFGMQANGILYLPPKPYAATVFELRDGTTAFGSWPNGAQVPDEVLSYRQNMTALLEGGKFNPWQRTWWGGTPKGWADNIHSTRSALCITKESFVAYLWGNDISAEVLAQGGILARCTYALHLDMNPGLAGFEFYNVQPAATWAPLGRSLQADWEYEGEFKELPGWRYRARRMVRGMQEQNFPQYIHRDARDFFYLARRPILPGLDLAPPANLAKEAGEGAWRVKGLPQHGFPYAMAITQVRPDGTHPDVRIRVLKVDPRTLRAAGSAGTTADSPTVLLVSSSGTGRAHGEELTASLVNGVFVVGPGQAAGEGGTTLAVGLPFGEPLKIPRGHTLKVEAAPRDGGTAAGGGPTRAVGVQDEDGMLLWVELAPGVPSTDVTRRVLEDVLVRAGCTSRMLVLGDTRALLGGTLDLTGNPTPAPEGTAENRVGTRLVRGSPPAARLYFEDTVPTSPAIWQPLQAQRVRYFHKPTPPAPKGNATKDDAGAPSPKGGTPTPAGGGGGGGGGGSTPPP